MNWGEATKKLELAIFLGSDSEKPLRPLEVETAVAALTFVKQEHAQALVRISNQDAMLGNLRANLEAERKGLRRANARKGKIGQLERVNARICEDNARLRAKAAEVLRLAEGQQEVFDRIACSGHTGDNADLLIDLARAERDNPGRLLATRDELKNEIARLQLEAGAHVAEIRDLRARLAPSKAGCKSCGGPRNFALNTVLQELCYDCAHVGHRG